MDRRALLQSVAALAALTALAPPRAAGARPKLTPSEAPLLKPRRLARGMTIGLIAPSSPAHQDEDLRFGVELIESLGFKVKRGPNLGKRWGYLAGSDAERAADLNAFFRDPEVDALFAFRGGYGSLRLLPFIDYDAIRAHPKVLLGFSDITALLIALHAKADLVTFHGPIAWWNMTEYTFAGYRRILHEGATPALLGAPPPFEGRPGFVREHHRLTTLAPGKAKGRLLGGNLSILCRLMGTPYQPDFKGRILFLEDVEEEPYRVDGMLTQLRLSGRLGEVAGIAFGTCDACKATGNSLSLEEILRDRLGDLGIPVLRGLLIGHQEDMATVPLGCEAELDADGQTLTLLEPGVA